MLNKLNRQIIKFICTLNLLFISSFCFNTNKKNDEITKNKWVLVQYLDPLDGEKKIIDKNDYLYGCSKKVVLEFNENGKLITEMNDKITFDGKYKLDGYKFKSIYPRINLSLIDQGSECILLDSLRQSCSIFLNSAKSFQITEDVLMIDYYIDNEYYTGYIGRRGNAKFIEYRP